MAAVRWSDIGNWNFFLLLSISFLLLVHFDACRDIIKKLCSKTRHVAFSKDRWREFSSSGVIKVSSEHGPKGHECRFSFLHTEVYRLSAAFVTDVWWHGYFSARVSARLRLLPVLASSWCGVSPWCSKQGHSVCLLWIWQHNFTLVRGTFTSRWHFCQTRTVMDFTVDY